MPLLWYMLSEEARGRLLEFYFRCFDKRLIPPYIKKPVVRVTGEIENLDEIDRIMKEAPGPKWRVEE